MGFAPPSSSSAGWKMKTAVPGSSARRAARISARVIAMAVWPSCPQACITPAVPEVNGASRSSVTGSASISARQAIVRPGLSPRRTPTTPVRARPVRTSSPAACSRSATIPAVRCSLNDSSGCRWKSRRSAINASSRLPTSSAQVPRVALIGVSLMMSDHFREAVSPRRGGIACREDPARARRRDQCPEGARAWRGFDLPRLVWQDRRRGTIPRGAAMITGPEA